MIRMNWKRARIWQFSGTDYPGEFLQDEDDDIDCSDEKRSSRCTSSAPSEGSLKDLAPGNLYEVQFVALIYGVIVRRWKAFLLFTRELQQKIQSEWIGQFCKIDTYMLRIMLNFKNKFLLKKHEFIHTGLKVKIWPKTMRNKIHLFYCLFSHFTKVIWCILSLIFVFSAQKGRKYKHCQFDKYPSNSFI